MDLTIMESERGSAMLRLEMNIDLEELACNI